MRGPFAGEQPVETRFARSRIEYLAEGGARVHVPWFPPVQFYVNVGKYSIPLIVLLGSAAASPRGMLLGLTEPITYVRALVMGVATGLLLAWWLGMPRRWVLEVPPPGGIGVVRQRRLIFPDRRVLLDSDATVLIDSSSDTDIHTVALRARGRRPWGALFMPLVMHSEGWTVAVPNEVLTLTARALRGSGALGGDNAAVELEEHVRLAEEGKDFEELPLVMMAKSAPYMVWRSGRWILPRATPGAGDPGGRRP